MDILNLPAVLFAVFVMYWSSAIITVIGVLKWADFTRPRCDGYSWGWFMMKFMGTKTLLKGENTLYRGGGCVFLCNHRSWADFFIDTYLTQGAAMLMSRWLVFYAFPVFMMSVRIIDGVVLFKRGAVKDKEKFNNWLDQRIAKSPQSSFLVYPEGTRSLKPSSLPLKRGMIHYAYSRKMPIQIIITANKETVLSEKRLSARFNSTLITAFSGVIKTSDFADFETFWVALQQEWDRAWSEAHSATIESCTPLVHSSVEGFDYPFTMRLNQALYSVASVLLLVATLYSMYYVAGFFPLAVRRVSVSLSMAALVTSLWKSGAFSYAR